MITEKMKILRINDKNKEEIIKTAAQAIKDNKILILPTETVYGISTSIFNIKGINKVYEIKKRNKHLPFIVLISNLRQLTDLVEFIPKDALRLIETFWPGPLTIIFKKNKKLKVFKETIAVRLTNCKITKSIIEESVPIISTSANIHNEKSPVEVKEIDKDIIKEVDLIIDNDKTKLKTESTIIDLTEKPFRIIREGAIKKEELNRFIAL